MTGEQSPVDMRNISFLEPFGEAAALPPESVSWRVFKNPVAMFIGGITATVLELAEPRIRAGVWDHTSFRDQPLPRLKRTGLAAMVTVYGAESVARKLIRGVNRQHAQVKGVDEHGREYKALQAPLMNWVHTTASFGFLQAYCQFVYSLPQADRDAFYSEALASAAMYGAPGCPHSEQECDEHFKAMQPQLGPTPVIAEFLAIMKETPALPGLLRPFQGMMIRAAVSLIPETLQQQLQLEKAARLRGWERLMIRCLGYLGDRIAIKQSPAVQSCQRLGLDPKYLYR